MRSKRRISCLVLAVGMFAVLLWGGLKAYRLVKLARSFQARIEAVEANRILEDPRQVNPIWASEQVHGTRDDFVALQRELEPWLWLAPAFTWLPEIGADLPLAPQYLEMGDAGTEMAVILADSLLPALDLYQQGQLQPKELVRILSDARLELVEAQTLLDRIEAARRAIPPGTYSAYTKRMLELLDQHLGTARLGLRAAELLPGAMGADGPRNYLLIAQNEDEIRPTGGFISSVGLLTVVDGEFLDVNFEDSYAVDDWANHPYPQLPAPFRQIMGDGIWLFRDANWSPDWPTSARQAVDLYQISRDIEIHGVIAVDQAAVRTLVGPLGPLTVREGLEVVAGNVLDFMREAWIDPAEGEEGEWMQYRKAFVGELATAMRAKLFEDLGSLDLSDLATVAMTALEEKHILLYLVQPDLASLIRQAGWDGAIVAPAGDFLMVVDANMGFNKVAPLIDSQIDYRVVLGPEPVADLVLTYTHQGVSRDAVCQHEPFYQSKILGYSELLDRCYWNYVRVYPAAAAIPISGSQHPLSGGYLTSGKDWPGEMVASRDAEGRLSLANFILLPWGQTQQLSFRYQLPSSVVEIGGDLYQYRLYLQKQPGTEATAVTVQIRLPVGAVLMRTDPAATQSDDDELLFDLNLKSDHQILVEWTE